MNYLVKKGKDSKIPNHKEIIYSGAVETFQEIKWLVSLMENSDFIPSAYKVTYNNL